MQARFERQRHILDYALSSLSRRKGKTIGLLLVFTFVVFTLASVLLFTRGLRAQAEAALAGAPDVVVQQQLAGRHDLVAGDLVERLAAIRGVAQARGRLWGYYYDVAAGANLTVLVPDAFWGGPREAVLGPGVARVRGKQAGDGLLLKTFDGGTLELKVREVAPTATELVASDLVLVGEDDFRAIFGVPAGRYTDIVIAVRNAREVPTVAEKAAALVPAARVVTRDAILRTYASIFGWRSGLVVVGLTGAVLAFLVVAWDKASGLTAEERREIGILKAIGWDTSDVLLARTWEGGALALAAFVSGTLLAYAHVYLSPAVLFRPVLEGWSGLYPDLRAVPSADPLDLAALFLLTVVPYAVATVVPAWRAATTDPDAVMRG